jgi:hypothetical protein
MYCFLEHSHLYLYADDSKLFSEVESDNDCYMLQDNLNKLVAWGQTWGMKFNPSKCTCMSFCNKKPILYTYHIGEIVLDRVNSFNDLGIIVSDKLTWDLHINVMLKKANKRLGLIKRCICQNSATEVKKLAYTSTVRPLVEYCSMVWHGSSKKSMCNIESLQRRATKYILNDYTLDYKNRLAQLNILPLSLRRDFLDLTFFCNCLNGLVDYDILQNVQFNVRNNRTRYTNDDLLLESRLVRTEGFKKFYTNRVIPTWNSLPFDIRNCELSDLGYNTPFKNSLKLWLYNFFSEQYEVESRCTWTIKCTCNHCRLV